jgi:hypothetical protein
LVLEVLALAGAGPACTTVAAGVRPAALRDTALLTAGFAAALDGTSVTSTTPPVTCCTVSVTEEVTDEVSEEGSPRRLATTLPPSTLLAAGDACATDDDRSQATPAKPATTSPRTASRAYENRPPVSVIPALTFQYGYFGLIAQKRLLPY